MDGHALIRQSNSTGNNKLVDYIRWMKYDGPEQIKQLNINIFWLKNMKHSRNNNKKV